ncbi:MAG: protein kinase domain-containing protein [Pyrinomonadaceae bacterium]
MKYAPYRASSQSIWRYSDRLSPKYPDQGWKIHVSGTPLNASQILRNITPILSNAQVTYKIPHSLDELMRINSGIFYGYSQIGKFVTVYPKNDGEFQIIARKLHQATYRFEAPQVPFDFRFADRSCVYFRYGRFKTGKTASGDNYAVSAITAPDGSTVHDDRSRASYVPVWAPTPSTYSYEKEPVQDLQGPFSTQYCVFRSIVQRGKGGVYEAIDMKRSGRRIIIKEGRSQGEVAWDGSDGADRLQIELASLTALDLAKVPVPKVLSTFENKGNNYLVLEKIKGVTLQALVDKCFAYLTINESLGLGLKIAKVVSQIHEAGWVWRDCKPANFLISPRGSVRPIDFEGACRTENPSRLPWASKGFASPESLTSKERDSNLPEDLYALGAVLHFLLTGIIPEQTGVGKNPILGSEMPKHLTKIISALLDPIPSNRPNAATVMLQLSSRRLIG